MQRPMASLKILGAALLCALAAGCATTEQISAAGDVRAFLISIRDDDRAAFDAHVDRPALERQLESRILRRVDTSDHRVAARALAAVLARPLSQLAGDALLQPQVFRSVAEYYGYKPDMPIPSEFTIAQALRGLPDNRVCAAKSHSGPCLMTFAQEDGVWRLVSFDGDPSMLRLSR
ncbi:MAG: hypothetical protein ACHP84_16360 [Caulobacterales bacterium]